VNTSFKASMEYNLHETSSVTRREQKLWSSGNHPLADEGTVPITETVLSLGILICFDVITGCAICQGDKTASVLKMTSFSSGLSHTFYSANGIKC